LADVYSTIAYYLRFRVDVEEYLARRAEQRAAVQRENEARSNYRDLRQRLIARLPKDREARRITSSE
jgi:hypothetical protein